MFDSGASAGIQARDGGPGDDRALGQDEVIGCVARSGSDLVLQLERFSVTLSCDGDVRDRGRGSNVLGSPLAAVAHLIALLAKQPLASALEADELVTTGTLTVARPIRAGETWSTAFDGIQLPGISVSFDA